MIAVNDLLKSETEDGDVVERVLYVDGGEGVAYAIDINRKDAMPVLKQITMIETGLVDGWIAKVAKDPYTEVVSVDELTPSARREYEKAMRLIADLGVDDGEPEIFEPSHRWGLIKELLKKVKLGLDVPLRSTASIYKALRRYWQRGKKPAALIPEYYKCGSPKYYKAKEKVRTYKVKPGRPRKYGGPQGKLLTVDEVRNIRKTLLLEYYRRNKPNLHQVYRSMLEKYYPVPGQHTKVHGKQMKALKPVDERPTFTQFDYIRQKEESLDPRKKPLSREGLRRYQQRHRETLGPTEVAGPYLKAQFDASYAGDYLVSRYNRKYVIGRPIIYLIVDVFSRLVLGLHIGLRQPSYAAAMMAVYNMAEDKVQFCKRYDIDLEPDEWQASFLAAEITTDRGPEMAGRAIEGLNALGVRIKNLQAHRPDWKGVVERYFRLLDDEIRPFAPDGYVPKHVERGDEDERAKAVLDIYQFTRIMIMVVLEMNNARQVGGYDLTEAMIEDEVQPIPQHLFQWGMKNHRGSPIVKPDDELKFHLMPKGEAAVTQSGIIFKDKPYSCDEAVQNKWFVKARNGSWRIDVRYDPRDRGLIYYRPQGSHDRLEICSLLSGNNVHKGKCLDEYDDYQSRSLDARSKTQASLEPIRAGTQRFIEEEVAKATEMTKRQLGKTSKAARLKDMKAARQDELAATETPLVIGDGHNNGEPRAGNLAREPGLREKAGRAGLFGQ